jgi:hypothetical protein
MKSLVTSNGGKVAASVTKAVTHLVTSQESWDAPTDKVSGAKANGLPIVTEQWVHESVAKGKLQNVANFSFEKPAKPAKSAPKSAKAIAAAATVAAQEETVPAPKKSGPKSAKALAAAAAVAAAEEEEEPEEEVPVAAKGKKAAAPKKSAPKSAKALAAAAAAAVEEPEPEAEVAKPYVL